MKKTIMIDPRDNVVTALVDISVGEIIDANEKKITTKQAIPFGHKVAIRKIGKGEEITKYGYVIGKASKIIEEGELVHIDNLESTRGTKKLSQSK